MSPTAAARSLDNQSLDAVLEEARETFSAANPKSRARHQQACGVMPGGNTRTILHYTPFPVTVAKGDGAVIWDIDGNAYTDFLGEYTAGLYGHSSPKIMAAVREALDGGIVLGGPNVYEATLADTMCKRFPAVERMRFTNSGTESNLLALSAARAFTGRSDILVIDRSYHGGVLTFAGDSPLNVPFPIHRIPYNDCDAAAWKIAELGKRLAAVIIEPMIGAGGGIPGDKEFLDTLRTETENTGAMLIFDEVMTSRLTAGGLHGYHGIRPDIVTFGKYIGGGMTFGGFGGRADLMDRFDPAKPGAWSHAGTFNNNVLTMAAGLVGLTEVYTEDVANDFFETGNDFREALSAALARCDVPMTVTGMGSMMVFHFTHEVPSAPLVPTPAGDKLLELLHLDMMARGQFYARRGMINLSLPMTGEDRSTFITNFEEVVQTRRSLICSVVGA